MRKESAQIITPPAVQGGRIRFIAFYLPQFHPIPENDEWWGKGFTEWTNVTKAQPLFKGHYQPHLPADLGFYDLRLRETRHEQIKMAKSYGIDGFCYHFYWFSGKRILHRPLDDMLADAQSDMPFCLCWANENWTRRWDAAEHEVLIAQHYHPEDDERFIECVGAFMADPRYIRLNGAPVLLVYRPQQLPQPQRTVDTWREWCSRNGIGDIRLLACLTHGNSDYLHLGFDGGVEFPPHNLTIGNVNDQVAFYEPFRGVVLDYHVIADMYLARRYKGGNVFRSVFPSWDNTARTGSRAVIVLNGTPENYEHWLAQALRKSEEDFPNEERFVFINAWNEWAEACHLEPDRKYGRNFLEATARVRAKEYQADSFPHRDLHVFEPDDRAFLGDLKKVFSYHLNRLYGRVSRGMQRFPRLKAFLYFKIIRHLRRG